MVGRNRNHRLHHHHDWLQVSNTRINFVKKTLACMYVCMLLIESQNRVKYTWNSSVANQCVTPSNGTLYIVVSINSGNTFSVMCSVADSRVNTDEKHMKFLVILNLITFQRCYSFVCNVIQYVLCKFHYWVDNNLFVVWSSLQIANLIFNHRRVIPIEVRYGRFLFL